MGGVAMSSDLRIRPLSAGRATENSCLKLAALSCRGHREMTFSDPLTSSKEASDKLLYVGRERREHGCVPSMWPWATAQLLGCVAQVGLLGTSLTKPGVTAEDRGPSPRPVT